MNAACKQSTSLAYASHTCVLPLQVFIYSRSSLHIFSVIHAQSEHYIKLNLATVNYCSYLLYAILIRSRVCKHKKVFLNIL